MELTETDFNRQMQDMLKNQKMKPLQSSGQTGRMIQQIKHEYKCQVCRDTGVVFSCTRDGEDFYRRCECQEMRSIEKRMQFADIPKEFKGYTVDSFDLGLYKTPSASEMAEMVKVLCTNYVDNFPDIKESGKGLYLYSQTKGSGKTRMAASIANDILARYRIFVKFATALQILNEIKKSWGENVGEKGMEQKFLSDIIKVPVLVIDDIGVEKPTAWVNEKFYEILNGRMIQQQVTIFTSNCDIPKLQLDDRITNRILKMALPVQFPEESVRAFLAQEERRNLFNWLLGAGG